MADEKLTKVTFTANVDHYVKGDVHELTADELKAVDAYAERWNIENPYKKGEAKVSVDENADALPSRTTTVTSADGERRTSTVQRATTTDAVVDEPAAPANETTATQETTASDGEGDQPATELPAASDKPVQGQGSTPKNATRKRS